MGYERQLIVDNILKNLTDDPMAILLDTSIKGVEGGGTGILFDWKIAEQLQRNHGLLVLIAGGLTPKNVGDAVRNISPWGVDVSSGVELNKGNKDPDAVINFVNSVKNAMNKCNGVDK